MSGLDLRNGTHMHKQEYQIKQSQFSKGQKKNLIARNNTKKVYKVQTKHKMAPTRINIVKVLYTNSHLTQNANKLKVANKPDWSDWLSVAINNMKWHKAKGAADYLHKVMGNR